MYLCPIDSHRKTKRSSRKIPFPQMGDFEVMGAQEYSLSISYTDQPQDPLSWCPQTTPPGSGQSDPHIPNTLKWNQSPIFQCEPISLAHNRHTGGRCDRLDSMYTRLALNHPKSLGGIRSKTKFLLIQGRGESFRPHTYPPQPALLIQRHFPKKVRSPSSTLETSIGFSYSLFSDNPFHENSGKESFLLQILGKSPTDHSWGDPKTPH